MVYDVKAAEQYIRQAAINRGMDPDIAVKVGRSEGLASGVWQSNASKNGVREPSYGPFQLLVGGGSTGYPTGMGNDFKARTGLDPSDPRNLNAGIDFALDGAAKNGWGAWYGAKAAGVGNWEGIKGARPIGIASAAQAQGVPAPTPAGVFRPTVENAAAGVQPFVQQAVAPAAAPMAPPPDPNAGKGLIAMVRDSGPMTFDKARTFLGAPATAGGASPIGAAVSGLAALAGGSQGSQAPQIQAEPIDAQRPDMSLLAMMMPKRGRKRMMV